MGRRHPVVVPLSILAGLADLGEARSTMILSIVEIVRMQGPMTRCDLEAVGGWRSGQVSGRVNEAIDRGLLRVLGKTMCERHEARGGVQLLDVPPWLKKGGRPTSLDDWGVEA